MFHARGWAPATSGNFSARLADGRIAITASGRHKGRLAEADIMTLTADGRPTDDRRPSAETAAAFADLSSVPGRRGECCTPIRRAASR